MNSRAHVLIVGAGVVGLTAALSLLKKGVRVVVIAENFAPNLTSVVAGALWEWPPAVCGHHQDQRSLARSKNWCMTSYRVFSELARDYPEAGVFIRPSVFYFRQKVAPSSQHFQKMEELRANVPDFRHDASLIAEHGVNPEYGVVDAYAHPAPMVDTDAYMQWLMREVEQHGCTLVRRRIFPTLRECIPGLRDEFGADVIVNCSGLGARELGDSSVEPLRGALVRVLSRSLNPPLEAAHCVSHDTSSDSQDMVFIVPRGRDLVVLGGLTEPNEWDKDINLKNYQPIQAMYERCVRFLPRLRSAELDALEPVRVGLRPFRKQNVRLEAESDLQVIHCYGHGGSGVTLSWGCAEEITTMILGSSSPA